MQVQFRKSETQKKHTVKLDAEGYYILEHHPTNWSEDCFIAVRKSAVDIVKDEPTYHIGQRFKLGEGICDSEYILAQVDMKKVTFIGVQNGNYWHAPISVMKCHAITVYELDTLSKHWRLA